MTNDLHILLTAPSVRCDTSYLLLIMLDAMHCPWFRLFRHDTSAWSMSAPVRQEVWDCLLAVTGSSFAALLASKLHVGHAALGFFLLSSE